MNIVLILKRKLKRSLAERGIWGTMKHTLLKVSKISLINNSNAKDTNIKTDNNFDKKYGTDTNTKIPITHLKVASENWVHGVDYEAIPEEQLLTTLNDLKIDIEKYIFIDYGSGKGRAVIIAAKFPFKKVIGIEFSPELNIIANNNLEIIDQGIFKTLEVEIVEKDAIEYKLPNEPLVLYMYNPFHSKIMEQVFQNIESSYKIYNRPIIILYFTPQHSEIFNRSTLFQKVLSTKGLCIYKTIESLKYKQ